MHSFPVASVATAAARTATPLSAAAVRRRRRRRAEPVDAGPSFPRSRLPSSASFIFSGRRRRGCAGADGRTRAGPSPLPAAAPLSSLSAPAYITEKIIVKAYLVENITERLYGWDEHVSVACLSAGVWMLALLIGNCCLVMHLLYSTPFHRACLD